MQFSATVHLPGATDEHPATMISQSDREARQSHLRSARPGERMP